MRDMAEGIESGADLRGPLGALLASMAAENNMNLRALSQRQPRLCACLRKFGFPQVAGVVAGLLTLPDNHPATPRIEALIHLAAMHCRGAQAPTLARVREWLNDILLDDPLGRHEDPVEDVFVSLAPSWTGSVRLFEGAWQDAGRYQQDAMAALLRLREQEWVHPVLEEVMALLRLSEAVAGRAGAQRYTAWAARRASRCA